MKKIFLALGVLLLSFFASSGEEIYKKSCVVCHTLKPGKVNIKDLKAPPICLFLFALWVKWFYFIFKKKYFQLSFG